ncbi:MAG: hypothetical protein COU27_02365 [Candidatus Levybacteria bacterium CG10_big_fil_rev_8_21_14_0_10_36_7]|nr:MAG: hypothetical protein COU27_02365 [Candidatus Levybacteria bacterium CG10_big_fil_rev_8_21_14_0_10_36_7]
MKHKIPNKIIKILQELQSADFEAYLVGGCVRDLLLGGEPKDWDITTNANPEEIQKVFPDSVYENSFGTVGVKSRTEKEGVESVEIIEITPYRLEAKYSDKRHPDEVRFARNIEDDLKRRDFTINAMAMNVAHETFEIVDLFSGQEDLKNKIIRTVGEPSERFEEDALRLLRAIRFSAQLGFEIEKVTRETIKEKASSLEHVSMERIRDEFVKTIMSKGAFDGIGTAKELGILKYIIPELEEGDGVEQSRGHIYTVWEHNLKALDYAVSQNWSFEVRLAVLLHDIGKPRSRRRDNVKKIWTFYGHDVIGERMSVKILNRLKFSKKTTDTVLKLVRYHMFFADPDKITLSAVRRMIVNVGEDHIWDLMNVRIADRMGMGRPKAEPYRLRKYESMIEEALRDPLSVGMLKINGNDLMKKFHMKPGPKFGQILNILLEDVLDDSEKNTEEYLSKRVLDLNKMSEEELKKLGEEAKEKKDELEQGEIGKLRKKWNVG